MSTPALDTPTPPRPKRGTKRPRLYHHRHNLLLDDGTERDVQRMAEEQGRDVGAMLRILVVQGIGWSIVMKSNGPKPQPLPKLRGKRS